MTGLTKLTIAAARDGLAKREFSAKELAEAQIRAVESVRDLNAMITETPDNSNLPPTFDQDGTVAA